MTTTLDTVALDDDYEFEFDATRKATTTGNLEAAAGLSGVSAHFATTKGGPAIAGTSTSLTERSAKDGRYYGILDAAAIRTALAAYKNGTGFGVYVVSGDAKRGREVLVIETAEPS